MGRDFGYDAINRRKFLSGWSDEIEAMNMGCGLSAVEPLMRLTQKILSDSASTL